MRTASETPTWEYWIPIWNLVLNARDQIQGNTSGFNNFGRLFGHGTKDDKSIQNTEALTSDILNSSRQEFLEDRAHTEMREDTAYQRAVADMRSAGLNPYTIGASSAPSSSSSVGSDSVTTKLQTLGYILEMKNLSIKNRQVTNQMIGKLLDTFIPSK